MPKLTAPQLGALRLYAMPDGEAIRQGWWPRRDVTGRLAQLGLLKVRTEMVHQGLTYRSRQRLEVVHVTVTTEGRALLDSDS